MTGEGGAQDAPEYDPEVAKAVPSIGGTSVPARDAPECGPDLARLVRAVKRHCAVAGRPLAAVHLQFRGRVRLVTVVVRQSRPAEPWVHPLVNRVLALFRAMPPGESAKGAVITARLNVPPGTIKKHLSDLVKWGRLTAGRERGYGRGPNFPG